MVTTTHNKKTKKIFFSSPNWPWHSPPHLQTAPSAVRARLCKSPDVTLTARSPPSAEGQQRRVAQPPHKAALALRQRRQLEAALLRPQADALQRKRGVEEKRDGRDASDVGWAAAREGAQEEVRGEVEEAGGRRRAWRGGGGGGGEVGWTS